jgi:hypothetical protein
MLSIARKLIADIPGFEGYELASDTDLELRGAAVLVQRAVLYLRATAARGDRALRPSWPNSKRVVSRGHAIGIPRR